MSTASSPIRCANCGVFPDTFYVRGSWMFCAACAGVPMTTPLAPRPEDAAEIARLRSIVAKWEALHADNVGALSDAGVRRNENDEISSGIEALDQDRDDLLAEWGVVLDFVFPHREPEDQYNGRDVVDAIQEMIEESR